MNLDLQSQFRKGGITMSAEENKAIVRRLIDEAWNLGNLDVIDEIVATDYIRNDPANPGVSGSEGLKQFVAAYQAAFPDIHIALEEQIAEGDKVANRWTITGTHQGEMMGIPPTLKKITIEGIHISRIASGKIVEGWISHDTLGMLQQLGVIPPMGQGGE
jgi:steroid delta-isomerase-like uncharacterized protein